MAELGPEKQDLQVPPDPPNGFQNTASEIARLLGKIPNRATRGGTVGRDVEIAHSDGEAGVLIAKAESAAWVDHCC